MKYYKEKIYTSYVSTHNQSLYGEMTLKNIETAFGLWDHYYGMYLPENKEATILDIGCGEGGFIYYLQKRGYSNSIGVDFSKEQIQKGKELGIYGGQEGDLFDFLGNNVNTYDFIVARDVLEHFTREEVYEILEMIFQSLKKGGRFLFQSPNGEGLQVEKIYEGDFTHETKFTEDSSSQVLKSLGFVDIICSSLLFPVSSLKSLFRMLGWKWMIWNHKIKRTFIYGSGKGIFTPNILVVASKPSE